MPTDDYIWTIDQLINLYSMTPYRYLLFFFIIATLYSCKKEERREIADLTFPSDTYYVSEGSEFFLYIMQGNQSYQVAVADESIIETRVEESFWPAGAVYVTGLKKGNTELTVKDMVTGQKATLMIHVVDPYLLLRMGSLRPVINAPAPLPEATNQQIWDEAMVYGAVELGPIVILHRNATQQFFTFETEKDLHDGKIKYSGTYELSFIEGGDQELILHYADDEKTSAFSLLVESQYAKDVLTSFSGDTEGSGKSSSIKFASSSSIKPIIFNPDLLAESPIENFDGYFQLIIDLTTDFKSKYPEVESVWLAQQAQLWLEYPSYGKIGDGVLK